MVFARWGSTIPSPPAAAASVMVFARWGSTIPSPPAAAASVMRGLALVLWLVAAPAAASTWANFDPEGYEAARRSGRIVLLQFMDRDCTACEEQEKILSRTFWGSPRTDWLGYRVDLVRNADVARALGVQGRSTLVLLRGARELGRSVGVIQEPEVIAFLRQADIPEPRGRAGARPKNRQLPRP